MIEHIIVSSMWQHIGNYNLVNNNEHGLCKRFSTITQLLDIIHLATKALAEQQTYHLVSFDFAKAFDKVSHHLLIHKMKFYKFEEVAELRLLLIKELKCESTRLNLSAVIHARPTLISLT